MTSLLIATEHQQGADEWRDSGSSLQNGSWTFELIEQATIRLTCSGSILGPVQKGTYGDNRGKSTEPLSSSKKPSLSKYVDFAFDRSLASICELSIFSTAARTRWLAQSMGESRTIQELKLLLGVFWLAFCSYEYAVFFLVFVITTVYFFRL